MKVFCKGITINGTREYVCLIWFSQNSQETAYLWLSVNLSKREGMTVHPAGLEVPHLGDC